MIMRKQKKTKEMFYFTSNYKKTLAVGIYIALLSLPYTILYPIIYSAIIDKYLPAKNITMVVALTAALILMVVLVFVMSIHSEIVRRKVYMDNDRQIKNKIFKAIQDAQLSEVEKNQTGKLFQITTTQAANASKMFVWNYVGVYSVRLKSIIVTIIIMLFIDWQITLIAGGILLASYLILMPFYSINAKIQNKLQTGINSLQAKINECLESYETTKTLRLEEINLNEIYNDLETNKEKAIKSSRIINIHSMLFAILSFAALIATIIVGGNKLIIGATASSTIMMMENYLSNINNSVSNMVDHMHNITNRYNQFLNILQIVSLQKEEETGNEKLSKVSSIEFKNVCFSYDGQKMVLNDISFNLEKPQKVAIVGRSGVGKTTLANLLPRFYPLTSGEILINGENYEKYELSELRKHISFVFQQPVVLSMSILENLQYGNNAKFEDVQKVCKQIGLHKKIMALDGGYACKIDNETDVLSFGEKQLLNYARAILKNGDIVILDEVTSNLDLEFERLVSKANNKMLSNKFAFIIAHRLNTIKNADLILFLENGKIKEIGTHNQLIENHGSYYELYKSRL